MKKFEGSVQNFLFSEIEDPVEQEDDNEDDEDGDYHDEDQKDESISPSKSRLERSERSSLKTRKKRNNKLIIEEGRELFFSCTTHKQEP